MQECSLMCLSGREIGGWNKAGVMIGKDGILIIARRFQRQGGAVMVTDEWEEVCIQAMDLRYSDAPSSPGCADPMRH